MLDKNSVKILRFLANHSGQYFTEYKLRQKNICVDYPIMKALYEQNYVVRAVVDEPRLYEWDDPVYEYQIDPRGRAKLEERQRALWSEFRAWATLTIALAAFIKSFFF